MKDERCIVLGEVKCERAARIHGDGTEEVNVGLDGDFAFSVEFG